MPRIAKIMKIFKEIVAVAAAWSDLFINPMSKPLLSVRDNVADNPLQCVATHWSYLCPIMAYFTFEFEPPTTFCQVTQKLRPARSFTMLKISMLIGC